MPVRSLNSSILRWPSRDEVDQALRQWIARHEADLTEAIAIGYFGSYARGDAGVGSDLDVVMILRQSEVSFTQRSQQWNFLSIPVPVEAQIYTAEEWAQLTVNQPRFHSTLVTETVWLSCPRSRNETEAESSAVAVGEGEERSPTDVNSKYPL